jgi:CBS domain-containing protein
MTRKLEEAMDGLFSILANKEPGVRCVDLGDSALDAVEAMCKHHVGALIVTDEGSPVGIVSERDVLTRVVLAHRDPEMTSIAMVMTPELLCVGPETDPHEAMAIMTQRRVRHLPIVQDGHLVGIVSIGDLVHWASMQRDQELRMLRAYVTGVDERLTT